MAVGCAPGGGLAGRPPHGMPAQNLGSASAWARFLMGLCKQRHEWHSRHLGVVGPAVGCAPGWGIVRRPLDGTPCQLNGQRFCVGPFLCGFWPPTPRTAGRGNRVPRPRALCRGGRPLEDGLALAPVPASDVLDERHEGESTLGGRRGVSSRLSRVVLPGIRPVLGARLHPSGRRVHGPVGGCRRPAVEGAFRPGGWPTGDELTVLLVTLHNVLTGRLEGESALG
jgi:hypothetical protein